MIVRLAAAAAAGVLALAPVSAVAAPAASPSSSGSQSSPFTGAVSASQNAGQGEAVLLSAKRIKDSAQRTFADKCADCSTILIFAGKDAPDFSDWIELNSRMQLLKQQFNAALTENTEKGVGATTALGEFTQAASYFSTDYAFGGETVATDDYLYAVAVARALHKPGRKVMLASQIIEQDALNSLMTCKPSKGPETCFSELDELRRDAAKASNALSSPKPPPRAGSKPPSTAGEAPQPPNPRKVALDNAIAAYDGLLAALNPTGGKAASPSLSKAVQEKAILRLLNEDGAVGLFLKVHTGTGGYYTKRNLWTLLGLDGLPIRISGGAVVSWVEVDSSGRFLDGDVIPLETRYKDPERVRKYVDPEGDPPGSR